MRLLIRFFARRLTDNEKDVVDRGFTRSDVGKCKPEAVAREIRQLLDDRQPTFNVHHQSFP